MVRILMIFISECYSCFKNFATIPDTLSQSTDSSCPPIQRHIQETPSEYMRNMGLQDREGNPMDIKIETPAVGNDVASVMTGDTRHLMEQLLESDDFEFDGEAAYEGDSLFVACELGDAEAAQRLLESTSTAKGKSIFNVFRRKPKYTIDVNLVDENGKTALHLASEQGFEEIVKKIFGRADTHVNKLDKNNQTALELACSSNQFGVVELLVKHPQISTDTVNHCLCLHSSYGPLEVVDLLLKHPTIDLHHRSNLKQSTIAVPRMTSLYGACYAGQLVIVQKLLEQETIDVNAGDENGATPISAACESGHLDIVEKLLERKEIEVNKARTAYGDTPLFTACQHGHLEIVKKLLERGEIEVNKVGTYGAPLAAASGHGHLEVVEKLLERNETEVNKAATDGCTPLFMACQEGHLEIVEKLLERDEIEVNKTRDTGATPLFTACQNGYLEIVEKLLERNEIEVNNSKNDGSTSLMISIVKGHLEIVEKFLNRADISVNRVVTNPFTPKDKANQIENGTTALMFAAYFGRQEIVSNLLAHPNIEVDQADHTGATATMIAEREGHVEIANLLRDHSSSSSKN